MWAVRTKQILSLLGPARPSCSILTKALDCTSASTPAHSGRAFTLLSRRVFSGFTPTKLYQTPAYTSTPDYAFGALVFGNVAALLASQADSGAFKQYYLDNMRASVEAMYSGRWHTLVTSIFSHTSTIHCAVNLAVLYFLRRFHALSTTELLLLYTLGGIAGSVAHVGYWWYDAGGPTYGPQYSCNTPGYLGCSGAVSAITAYKVLQQPFAYKALLVLPVPVLLLELLYICLEVKEKEYYDGPPAKTGGAAVGVLFALLAALTKQRVPLWLQRGARQVRHPNA